MDKTDYSPLYLSLFILFLILGITSFRYDPDRPLPHASCMFMSVIQDIGIWNENDVRCRN